MSNTNTTLFFMVENETIEEALERLGKETGARKGYGRPIELILRDLSFYIEQNWKTLVPPEFKRRWLKTLENSQLLEEIPDLGPDEWNETTSADNYSAKTTDSPTNRRRTGIRYHIHRQESGGMGPKMFEGPKELFPRRRFDLIRPPQIQNGEQVKQVYTVMAKTVESIVYFRIYARTTPERDFFYKATEYIFYTNRKMVAEFGLQRLIPLGMAEEQIYNNKLKMHQKTLAVYTRHEEYFISGPTPIISDVEYNWDDIHVYVDSSNWKIDGIE